MMNYKHIEAIVTLAKGLMAGTVTPRIRYREAILHWDITDPTFLFDDMNVRTLGDLAELLHDLTKIAEQYDPGLVKALEIREQIRAKRAMIDKLNAQINQLAEDHIEDFHFLDWRVSTFWTCDASPIGMCVFPSEAARITENLGEPYCRYCGGPEERK